MKYAEVVVDTPVRRRITPEQTRGEEGYNPLAVTFHYSIPPRLAGEIDVGQLIKVPFGPRHLQGIVVSLTDTSPVAETRDIEEVLEPEPVLSPVQIKLARWISSYYLPPLRDCLRLMLPPGLARRSRLIVQLKEGTPLDNLSGEEWAVVELLRRQGKVELRDLDQKLDVPDIQSLVDGLERKGVVVKRWELAEPRVRPKRERFVRLIADETKLEDKLTGLRRLDVYTSILDFLKAQGDLVPVSEVYTETDSSLYYLRKLAERGLVRIEEREVWREPLAGREFVLAAPPKLTPDQKAVWREIEKGIESQETRVYLLHGVTGSGKTEIYLRALQEVLARSRQAIVMVPEISLTPQTIRRFAARFPARLAVLHSKLSLGERYDEWRRIRTGRADVVIGPRSAIFAPLHRLGLIVVDEEYSNSYKQERVPHYYAREVAVKLAELSGSVVILGSATPDLVSYHRAQRGRYKLLCLPKRILGHRRRIEEQKERYRIKVTSYKEVEGFEDARYLELPLVQVVDMRQELKAGNRSIFSRALQRAIGEALDRKQQVILFLNRRGAATFVMCRDCGHVLKCSRCEVPLTYHAAGEALICHHCNRSYPTLNVCPNCGSYRIKFFGVGTQRVEATMQNLFPGAHILRWDRDTTGGKLSHEELLAGFIDHEADVLVGTQMIAKGLDLPLVTLVGVVSADTALHLPDFRAAERTFQLLTQVAGRAGRSILGGKVIVQTYTPEHYSIRMASQHNYQGFYERELEFRRQQGYPPFNRLAKLVYFHSNRERCRKEAERVHRILSNKIARLGLPGIDLIGLAPCFFSRLRGKYRWQIVVRAPKPQTLLRDIALPRGWQVDIDPLNTL